MRKRAKEEGEKISEGEKVSSMYASKPTDKPADKPATAKPADKPATAKPAATAKPSAATGYLKNPGAVSPSVGNQRGPRAGEIEAYRQQQYAAAQAAAATPEGKAARQRQAESQAVEGVYPESNLIAPGLKTAHSIAKGLANRFGGTEAKAASEIAAKGREAVTNPLMWMAGPKNAKNFDEAAEVASKGREAVTNPMAWMAGPKGMAEMNKAGPSMATRAKDAIKETADKVGDRFRKKPMSEADTAGGAIGYKRGGKVRGYASGGSVSSASSRGDGIATKGKTRGKIY
jgi:hypothetical protein